MAASAFSTYRRLLGYAARHRLYALAGIAGIKNKLAPGPASDKELYDLPP